MDALRIFTALLILTFVDVTDMYCRDRSTVVADSLTRQPLAGASIFDHGGRFIGVSTKNGNILCATHTDYPLTVRYMGYHEGTVAKPGADTLFLPENVAELPEVVVDAKQRKMLHILAYAREYSTLSGYTDTVTMFREKMVDFMLPADAKTRFRGWRYPRVLKSRSYYRFTDAYGLDSVSDRCNNHFTWSDWIGIFPTMEIPARLVRLQSGTDTIYGRYSPAEIWRKGDDRVSLDVNVLADTASRRWVPNISLFFKNGDTDFEQFHLRMNYGNVTGGELTPLDLTGYSFNIESRGRGHGMFMFNRHDEPFFVTTYTEVYILDKEFITVKEAKKWGDRKFNTDAVEIFEPLDAPGLQPSTLALIERVNSIDADRVRLSLEPDRRLIGRNINKNNFSFGNRFLSMLKDLTGISSYKSRKNADRNWNQFRDSRRKRNRQRGGAQ